MSESQWSEAREVAREAVIEAWTAIEPLYEQGNVVTSKPDGPQTTADRLADRIIAERLQREFPPDRVGYLTEESADSGERLDRDRVWIIDPIDGTLDFINKAGNFALQAALIERDESGKWLPAAAVVFIPCRGLLLSAERGAGSWVEVAEPDGGWAERTRLKVSDRSSARSMRAVASANHPTPELANLIERFDFESVARLGSIGVKISLIASGDFDVYINPVRGRCKQWDCCPPDLILTEAGGRLTDLDGRVIEYNGMDPVVAGGLLASNGKIHDQLVEDLRGFESEAARQA